MLLGTKKTLYDHTTEALLEKEGPVSYLEEYLKNKKISATIQGIYKTLRELIAENIVIKQKKIYIINNVWRDNLVSLVSKQNTFNLSANERIIYQFNKLDHVDLFWKHTWVDIEKEYGIFPVVEFMPHQFWLYLNGRKESEYEYYNGLKNKKTMVYTNIGGISLFDKNIKKLLDNEYHQTNTDKNSSFSRRDHIVIIGPYIITTRISKTLSDTVDKLYQTITNEEILKEKLNILFKKSESISLILEHNEMKAKKLLKILTKDFYISKEIREQFSLF